MEPVAETLPPRRCHPHESQGCAVHSQSHFAENGSREKSLWVTLTHVGLHPAMTMAYAAGACGPSCCRLSRTSVTGTLARSAGAPADVLQRALFGRPMYFV